MSVALPLPSSPDGLVALERQVHKDLQTIEVPLRSWVPERLDSQGRAIADVVIVGAGLSGLAIAFGLYRQGITRTMVLDAAEAGREGPWVTSARMRTLRSPKTMTGPDLGVPSLTYRAWHEASYGEASWEGLDLIDRHDWMAYLGWFRRVVGIDVLSGTRLTGLSGSGRDVVAQIEGAGGRSSITARKLVLATGIEGAGGAHVPQAFVGPLPRDRWSHSAEVVDIAHVADKDVGVVGAASSSFDWAVAALEAGARTVTILARSAEMPVTEILDWSNFPGFLNNFAELDDERRYAFTRRMLAFKTPPTVEMYTRAMSAPNATLVTGAAVKAARMDDGRIRAETTRGDYVFDHLLFGTGYALDMHRRPELAGIVDLIATWGDRMQATAGDEDNEVLRYPYLGPGFELTEKQPGTVSWLPNIHLFNNGAVPSMGPVCNGLTGLKSGVPRLVSRISRDLFIEDADQHYQSLDQYRKAHFAPPPHLLPQSGQAR